MSQCKAALKLLEAVKREGGLAYRAAALLLKAAIEECPVNALLPPRFDIDQMAMFIAESNEQESDKDLHTPIHHWHQTLRTEVNVEGNVLHLRGLTNTAAHDSTTPPRDSRPPLPSMCRDLPHDNETQVPSATRLNQYMQGYLEYRYNINLAARKTPPTYREKSCPTPHPAQGTQNPLRRQSYDLFVHCHACGRTGHPAVQCDTLGMAILIRKYMDFAGNAVTMKQASEQWFQHNAKALKCPENTRASDAWPLHVLHYYADQYFKDIDEIDDQMDWEYFQQDTAVDVEGATHANE